jgi:hypothetical protein
MKLLFLILIVTSAAVAVLAIGYLTQITLGVGIMAGACYLGIVARIVQAEIHSGDKA